MLGAGNHSGLHRKISGKCLREMLLGDDAELKVSQDEVNFFILVIMKNI